MAPSVNVTVGSVVTTMFRPSDSLVVSAGETRFFAVSLIPWAASSAPTVVASVIASWVLPALVIATVGSV